MAPVLVVVHFELREECTQVIQARRVPEAIAEPVRRSSFLASGDLAGD